ncbi:MAG: DNA-directed RNA polymerase subunit alpha [Chloroflexi bacterium]|nr:DNA-directed RNA polymerase subunit alpha [Chloroflexota bacterium]MBU1750892.1 DNA-directed RNA polymerase subunit alpha [Chloroflexota bacterium]MBU1879475.1 DNA-directed RNA polymerase subunit alpha [Chloroflexota bacterium]
MLDIILPQITSLEETPEFGRFAVGPMEGGYGITIGNALRRVLLSSLPGAAVTSVRISGIWHEFSDIPHVREDAMGIVLNLKRLGVQSLSDEPVIMRLHASGQREVTAADITAPPEIEIVNPELHIATLDTPEAVLDMEMTVERGRGYQPAEAHEGELPIGTIPVDAIFSPVRKVQYEVERARIGQATDYDRLLVSIWTNGTLRPRDAFSRAAQILVRHFSLVMEFGLSETRRPEEVTAVVLDIPSQVYDAPIEDLDLSVRAYNCLKRSGITRVGQVLEMSEDDLLAVWNFGRKSLDELRDQLQAKGYIDYSLLAPVEEAELAPEE